MLLFEDYFATQMLGCDVFEPFPCPGITGKNWPLFWDYGTKLTNIPGYFGIPGIRNSTFFLINVTKRHRIHMHLNCIISSYFSSTNYYLCKKKPFEIMKISK